MSDFRTKECDAGQAGTTLAHEKAGAQHSKRPVGECSADVADDWPRLEAHLAVALMQATHQGNPVNEVGGECVRERASGRRRR